MRIRRMLVDDIDYALTLTSAEGWHTARYEFEDLLEYDKQSCLVGEESFGSVGIVCTIPYGTLGFIGNLIVSREYRGKGRGKELMMHALKYLRKMRVTTVMLDAVQAAVPFYKKLGFQVICKSLRFKGIIQGGVSDFMQQMLECHLPEVCRLDSSHFGANRSFFIKKRFAQNPHICRIMQLDTDFVGYIMGVEKPQVVSVGPWIMDRNFELAENFLKDLAACAENRILRLGVLENNSRAVTAVKDCGLVEQSHSVRMVLGSVDKNLFSDSAYAIGSPAKG